MARSFNATSTADEVLEGIDLRGMRVVVTGVSTGIGLETARALAARGANVTGTARDVTKAERHAHAVREEARPAGGGFQIVAMDLADLDSVRAVADELVGLDDPIHLLIANAGVMGTPLGRTKQGHELQFGTNFLGHFALATRLAPQMHEGARLIVLTSNAHRMGDIDLDDLNFERTPYDPWVAYGRSKTADALLAVAFDGHHRARGVRAACVHPGVITTTELGRSMDPEKFQSDFKAMTDQYVAMGNPPFEPKTIQQGAATSVWAGIVASAEIIGGKYCEDCGVGELLTDANVSAFAAGVLPYALDSDRAEALWLRAKALVD